MVILTQRRRINREPTPTYLCMDEATAFHFERPDFSFEKIPLAWPFSKNKRVYIPETDVEIKRRLDKEMEEGE